MSFPVCLGAVPEDARVRALAAGRADEDADCRVILHHGHIRPVLIRDWSRSMDGIAATIWADQTTPPPRPDDRLKLAA